MNRKPYNKCLIDFVCSVRTGKYLPSVFFSTDCTKTSSILLSRTDRRGVGTDLNLGAEVDMQVIRFHGSFPGKF